MSKIELTCHALPHLFQLWRWALPQGKLLLYFWITSTNPGFISCHGLTKEVSVIVKLILQVLAHGKMVLLQSSFSRGAQSLRHLAVCLNIQLKCIDTCCIIGPECYKHQPDCTVDR